MRSNRPTEWFSNIRVVLTTTEIDNWDELRNHKRCSTGNCCLAEVMIEARNKSVPTLLKKGEWHLLLSQVQCPCDADDVSTLDAIISIFSTMVLHYTTEEDLALYDRLVGSRPDWSP